jgi:hypothetical protein
MIMAIAARLSASLNTLLLFSANAKKDRHQFYNIDITLYVRAEACLVLCPCSRPLPPGRPVVMEGLTLPALYWQWGYPWIYVPHYPQHSPSTL